MLSHACPSRNPSAFGTHPAHTSTVVDGDGLDVVVGAPSSAGVELVVVEPSGGVELELELLVAAGVVVVVGAPCVPGVQSGHVVVVGVALVDVVDEVDGGVVVVELELELFVVDVGTSLVVVVGLEVVVGPPCVFGVQSGHTDVVDGLVVVVGG